jgi:hypothetical protein
MCDVYRVNMCYSYASDNTLPHVCLDEGTLSGLGPGLQCCWVLQEYGLWRGNASRSPVGPLYRVVGRGKANEDLHLLQKNIDSTSLPFNNIIEWHCGNAIQARCC